MAGDAVGRRGFAAPIARACEAYLDAYGPSAGAESFERAARRAVAAAPKASGPRGGDRRLRLGRLPRPGVRRGCERLGPAGTSRWGRPAADGLRPVRGRARGGAGGGRADGAPGVRGGLGAHRPPRSRQAGGRGADPSALFEDAAAYTPPAPRVAAIADPGLGKTEHAMREILAPARCRPGAPRRLRRAQPPTGGRHRGPVQRVAGREVARVWRGLEQPDPDDPDAPMCRRFEADGLRDFLALGGKVQQLCGGPRRGYCRHHPDDPARTGPACAYVRQRRSSSRLWVVPAALLTQAVPRTLRRPEGPDGGTGAAPADEEAADLLGLVEPVRPPDFDLVVIDEAPWLQLVGGFGPRGYGVRFSDLDAPELDAIPRPPRGRGRRRVAARVPRRRPAPPGGRRLGPGAGPGAGRPRPGGLRQGGEARLPGRAAAGRGAVRHPGRHRPRDRAGPGRERGGAAGGAAVQGARRALRGPGRHAARGAGAGGGAGPRPGRRHRARGEAPVAGGRPPRLVRVADRRPGRDRGPGGGPLVAARPARPAARAGQAAARQGRAADRPLAVVRQAPGRREGGEGEPRAGAVADPDRRGARPRPRAGSARRRLRAAAQGAPGTRGRAAERSAAGRAADRPAALRRWSAAWTRSAGSRRWCVASRPLPSVAEVEALAEICSGRRLRARVPPGEGLPGREGPAPGPPRTRAGSARWTWIGKPAGRAAAGTGWSRGSCTTRTRTRSGSGGRCARRRCCRRSAGRGR